MTLWQHIELHITQVRGEHFSLQNHQAVAGGSINSAQRISGHGQDYFVKTNHVSLSEMFVAEAKALKIMAKTKTLRVPEFICHGHHDQHCYLVLEYLPLQGRADMLMFGQQLAAMHRCSSNNYGWSCDNTIGLTPQINKPNTDWIDFWRQQRLGYQLTLAARNGYGGELQHLGERLLADFHVLFATYTPDISMLHGDLWGGNFAALEQNEPVVFDPALYYGDRETDLAMTHLFGGFDARFYSAYNDAWPLDSGYKTRQELYNTYHILNHLNLFGGRYLAQAVHTIQRLLSEL